MVQDEKKKADSFLVALPVPKAKAGLRDFFPAFFFWQAPSKLHNLKPHTIGRLVLILLLKSPDHHDRSRTRRRISGNSAHVFFPAPMRSSARSARCPGKLPNP
jgi:hypothetical protein